MRRILCLRLPPGACGDPATTAASNPGPSAVGRGDLESWAAWCHRFSPLVGIEPTAEPASLLLDVSGLAHLFGGEAALAEQVVGDFAARGLSVRLALADTLGAPGQWCIIIKPMNCPPKPTGHPRSGSRPVGTEAAGQRYSRP